MDPLDPHLSFDEALDFLKNILKIVDIDENIRDATKDVKFSFLSKIIQAFHIRLPFQNVSMLSLEPSQRRAPTWSDIKADMMAGVGGLCLTLNAFMYALLTSLSYDVFLAMASVSKEGTNSHALVILRNGLKEGDVHIIEAGFGFPTFTPIPWNCERGETDEYVFSFVTLKYIRRGELLIRLHKTTCSSPGGVYKSENGWSFMYYFNLSPFKFADFYDDKLSNLEPLYTDPAYRAPFFRSLRMIQWEEDGTAKAIRDNSLLVEKNGELHESMIDDSSLKQTVLDNFPLINPATLEKALVTWQQCRHIKVK